MNDDWVPSRLKLDVYEYARQAGAELGLYPPIEIEWHRTSPPGKQWNAWVEFYADIKYKENVIHVNVEACSSFTPDETRWLIFHESRHLWQNITSRHLGGREAERDAWEWATKASGCFNNPLKQANYWDY